MLASGDWLVPRVGSDPYLRKPPLLNWAIALSCKFSGGISEWAVRLPSVLATFALTITIVRVAGGRWLGHEGGLIAAIFFLTNFTMIETGRLAELEALYVSLTGIALVLWMTAWRRESGSWQLWILPAPFLALGMLTKGPTHLIFYYGVILPVLLFGRNVRSLLHPAHFFSLVLIVGALLCWAIPCSLAVSRHNPIGVWRFWWDQLASRASAESDEHFRLSNWLLNGPQTLKNFLPWTLLLPLLWRKETVAMIAGAAESRPRELALFRGARCGMVATYRADDSFAEWFAALYLSFDCCSLSVVGACIDCGWRLEHSGMAASDLEPAQPSPSDDCLSRHCGDAVRCPRRSLDSALDVYGRDSGGRHLVFRRRKPTSVPIHSASPMQSLRQTGDNQRRHHGAWHDAFCHRYYAAN